MFPGRTELELEVGVLRSGRIFKLGKRRKTERGWWNPSLFEGSEHKLRSCEDEGSYDEEEDYSPILEGTKNLDRSNKTSRSEHNYITPTISPETRSRVSSPGRTSNSDNTSPETSAPEGTPQLNPTPENLNANIMAKTDVWLPTFNGNGTEDPEQHWFLCEAVWMVCLVYNSDIKKGQMITTLRGHTLDWLMKFCVIPARTP